MMVIGDESGANLSMDRNEIMARNNGSTKRDLSLSFGTSEFHQSVVNLPSTVADTFTTFRGLQVSGTLADTFESDDCYLQYIPGIVLNPTEAPVWLIFDATLPSDSPNSLGVIIEGSANTVGLSQTVEMYDWISGIYEEVDVRSASLNTDAIVTVDVSANISDCVQAGTGAVRSRFGWRKDGFIFVYPWTISIDQVIWTTD